MPRGKRTVLITGGTGFIGRRLVKKLLAQKQTQIYLLVRRASFPKIERLIESLMLEFPDAPARIHVVSGDLSKPMLLESAVECAELQKKVQEVFHLAAHYELGISREDALKMNVEGTLHMLAFARGCEKLNYVHYVSTIAVAGDYKGVWHEDMLLAGQQFDNYYAYTKFLAEVEVRAAAEELPIAIYRPGVVVGDSNTGEMDKVDGPYYFLLPFMKLQAFTRSISPIIPIFFPISPGAERIKCHIVPVDYVVNCLDYISRKKGIEGKTFSLSDPNPVSIREVIDVFCDKAGWVRPVTTLNTDALVWMLRLPGIKQLAQTLEPFTGMPVELIHYTAYTTKYDATNTKEFLKGSDISCPNIKTYAGKLLSYARRHFV